MNKCHTPITWVNDQAPAINDTHLNQYDGELDTLDDRIITLDSTKALQSDLLLAFKDVALNSTTGVITFTLFNNTTKTIDTLLEKIAINFDYDDDPTSPHYQNLIIELEDGTYKYIDMSALITEYEFTDSSTIDFTVTSGAVSASVIDGSITSTKLDPAFAVTISNAETNGLKSEGWAVGEQNGTPVTSGSPYYQNNAKWYKEQAQAIAGQTLGGLTDVTITTPTDGDVLAYNSTSQEWGNSSALQDSVNYLYQKTGWKNILAYPYYNTSKSGSGVTWTDNGDGSVTVVANGTATQTQQFVLHSRMQGEANDFVLKNGSYILSGCPSGGSTSTYWMEMGITKNGAWYSYGDDVGQGLSFSAVGDDYSANEINPSISLFIGAGVTISLTFYPMIRAASISDSSWVPYRSDNFVSKTDLTSIIATGSTNTTGAQIPNGAYFYLNGIFCRAIADIATNATFTKNTNYKETTVGAEISGGIVRMSVNSSMTYASALNAFAALIDFSKITPKSSFRVIETGGMTSCFCVSGIMSNELRVTRTNNGTSIKCIGFYIKTSSSMAYTTQATTSGTTYTDDSSSALYSGYQAFELEY